MARYIRTGEFGLWRETGELNDWVAEAAAPGPGARRKHRPPHRIERLSAQDPQRPGRRLPPLGPRHRPRRHRLRHPARASQLRRRGFRRGQLPRLPDLRPRRRAPGRRRPAQLRLRHHGARSLSESAGHGAQRGAPGGPRDPPLHHRRLRPRSHSTAISTTNCPRPIPAIISGRTRPSWCAPSPTAARASISAAIIAPPSPRCAARFWSGMTTAEILAALPETLRAGGGRHLPGPLVHLRSRRRRAVPRDRHPAHRRRPDEVTPARAAPWPIISPRSGSGRVGVLGVVGQDGFGHELSQALERRGIEQTLCMPSAMKSRPSPTPSSSTPPPAVEDLPRIDFINTSPLAPRSSGRSSIALRQTIEAFDVILVSDQAETSQGGVVTPAVA